MAAPALPFLFRRDADARPGAPWLTAACALLVVALSVVLSGLAAFAQQQPKFPVLTGRVVDEARLLSAAEIATLTQQLATLEAKSSDQLVVVTLTSLQGYEIADYGYRLGRAWGIGQKERKDNGVLLIVAPTDKKVRIEVGRGLEPVLTDALSRLIIETRILPAFRRGEFAAGVLAGARDIQDALLGDAQGVEARAKGARRPANKKATRWTDWIVPGIFALFFGASAINAIRTHRAEMRLPPAERAKLAKRRERERRRNGVGGGAIGSSSSGGGGWSSGGGSSSDGGFSGGGGSFGGGGASSDW